MIAQAVGIGQRGGFPIVDLRGHRLHETCIDVLANGPERRIVRETGVTAVFPSELSHQLQGKGAHCAR